jgi:hypothetical protein
MTRFVVHARVAIEVPGADDQGEAEQRVHDALQDIGVTHERNRLEMKLVDIMDTQYLPD